ncbi:ABC transporter permease [Alkaliphilus pronyensis]|uniref:ABC transporter permease n=1 Tax=Alkaliphilus pronyensis TaxID=1482732 RepID=A0A6I0F7P9_9FIRM|nr:ABC transporter permease [Alkaliphilus pronyensis]KAB3530089.1 ABC transporter permease [Alkaliphilus pronyensis]
MWTLIAQIFPYAIAFTIPLLITALGGLFSERSGVVNIGLEGLMVVGSFSAAMVIYSLQPTMSIDIAVWIGLLAAALAGGLFSLLHAFASINLNANQVISGTAINMMAGALTVFLARNVTGSGNIPIVRGLIRRNIPVLSEIPIIGRLFFTGTYATTWLVLVILFIGWFVIYKTSYGLRLRACGEHPHAADSAGVNVYKTRYIAVIISGAFSGLGGGILLVTIAGEFTGSVAGLGFLALASLIFGQWKPLGILGATAFFGIASTIANVSSVIPMLQVIPGVLLKVFPYVVTLIALVAFSKSSQAPKAAGEPYEKGKR